MSTILETSVFANECLAQNILQNLLQLGVVEFCICPGARNSPLITVLHQNPQIKQFYFYEERSAAFFALGRSRSLNAPVAIIVTSGTAAAELLPAAMEGYYTGVPLVLITADRPRRYRGSNAPQTAEQVGLFGQYAIAEFDLANGDEVNHFEWSLKGPCHVNICFEEPQKGGIDFQFPLEAINTTYPKTNIVEIVKSNFQDFLDKVKNPFVIVGGLKEKDQFHVINFLKKLGAPVFLEGISGLREKADLQALRIAKTEDILNLSAQCSYPIDGIIRIGGIPTFRLWRDVELLGGQIPVFSLNDVPFSGLSWGQIQCYPIDAYLASIEFNSKVNFPSDWKNQDLIYQMRLEELFQQHPQSEQAICHYISKKIPSHSMVYLGNSMPIREWDEFAANEEKSLSIYASRGLNGIDGQISTFLGLCKKENYNFGLFGDLTALYDLAAPWILREMKDYHVNILIMNNGGGRIFHKMFQIQEIQNLHQIQFKSFAEMWGLDYYCLTSFEDLPTSGHNLIEFQPDWIQTQRFWDLIKK